MVRGPCFPGNSGVPGVLGVLGVAAPDAVAPFVSAGPTPTPGETGYGAYVVLRALLPSTVVTSTLVAAVSVAPTPTPSPARYGGNVVTRVLPLETVVPADSADPTPIPG